MDGVYPLDFWTGQADSLLLDDLEWEETTEDGDLYLSQLGCSAEILGKAIAGTHHETQSRWKVNAIRHVISYRSDAIERDVGDAADGPATAVTDVTMKLQSVAKAISQSWKIMINPQNDDLVVRVQEPSTVEMQDLSVIEYVDPYDRPHEEVLKGLQMYSVAATVELVARRLIESTLTERQFLAHHLDESFSPAQIADWFEEEFDAEQTPGAVRKQQSRVREKQKAAEFTLDATNSPELTSEVPDLAGLEAADDSPLTDALKTQIYHEGYRHFQGEGEQTMPWLSYEVNSDCTIVLQGDVTWGKVHLRVFVTADSLSDTIAVRHIDGDAYHEHVAANPDPAMVMRLSQLSPEFNALSMDLIDILEELSEGGEIGGSTTEWIAETAERGPSGDVLVQFGCDIGPGVM